MLKKLLYIIFTLLTLSFAGKASNLVVCKVNDGKMPVLVERRFFKNDMEFNEFRLMIVNSLNHKILTKETQLNFFDDRFYWRMPNKNNVYINAFSIGDMVFLASQLMIFITILGMLLVSMFQKNSAPE